MITEHNYNIEEINGFNTKYEYGEAIQAHEAYYLIIHSKVKNDTIPFLIGIKGIKSCVRLLKGKQVFWMH